MERKHSEDEIAEAAKAIVANLQTDMSTKDKIGFGLLAASIACAVVAFFANEFGYGTTMLIALVCTLIAAVAGVVLLGMGNKQ